MLATTKVLAPPALHKRKKIALMLLGAIGACLNILLSTAHAFTLGATEEEYQAMSPQCQAIYSSMNDGKESGFGNRQSPAEIARWREIADQHGGAWHYCASLVWMQRAVLATNEKDRKWRYDHVVSEALFSYTKTDDSKPWKAEMGTTIAKGYRGLGDIKNAKHYLAEVNQKFPDYYEAYTVSAIISRDEKNYQAAKESLLKANEYAKDQSAEVLYFLGLVSIDLNEIDAAKQYAEKAYALGYPLPGLKQKLKKYE